MGYLCQAPKEYKDQRGKWKKDHPFDTLMDSGNYIALRKYDGCCCIVDTSTGTATSRTGEPAVSMEAIAKSIAERMGPGFKVYGEAYRGGWDFPKISGEFRRREVSQELQLIVWDIVQEGDEGASFNFRMTKYGAMDGLPRVFKAERLKSVTSVEEAKKMASELQDNGLGDGVILRDVTAPWAPGAAKNGEVIKVKPRMSLDLRCVGYFPGKGKHTGVAGGIIVMYHGVETEVGTGFSDDMRARIPGLVQSIAEVECLGITVDGKLREPSFKGWRFDKLAPDA